MKNITEPVLAYFVVQHKGFERFLNYEDTPQLKLERSEPGSLAVMLFKKPWQRRGAGIFL
ncbi:MAG: hypothetical protein CM1200mP30_20030 [Pseudomonadota bacterium]|nr:MAG: hypothetical protein CM1200mP30_20030 [Pseudomonadota bacterium]